MQQITCSESLLSRADRVAAVDVESQGSLRKLLTALAAPINLLATLLAALDSSSVVTARMMSAHTDENR